MKIQGMTLIEVTAALVVLGFLAAYLLLPLEVGLMDADKRNQNMQASYLSQERAFLIFAKKQEEHQHFSSLSDPCPGVSVCVLPSGFSINTLVTTAFGSRHLKLVTTTVSGHGDANLQFIVSDHANQ